MQVSSHLENQRARQVVDYTNLEHQQLNRARQDAEALFRPKPKIIESSTRPDQPLAEVSVRKPRILSAGPAAPNGPAEILKQTVTIERDLANRFDRIRAARKRGCPAAA
ncbi:MAG: hypothetical protein JO001_24865 [Alphaproteobacteria bacterium]|nr:hypothetical protein [Alphaproteobacteria bacterium]